MSVEKGYPSTSLPQMEGLKYWTYDVVEARLVEAMQVARRLPDRERGWLAVRAYWPSIVRERCLGDYDAYGYLGSSSDLPVARVPLASAEIDALDTSEGWALAYVPECDRKMVALALGWLVAGRRIGWRKLRLVLGWQIGPGAVQRRYERAIALICCGLNGKGAAGVKAVLGARARAGMMVADGDASVGQRSYRRRVVVDIEYR